MNLLIVDDSATNLKLLRAQLEEDGHAVAQARDGAEALELLDRQLVDAVISDILMPRMDGYRLCHEIRKNNRLRDLPVIVYTSTYNSSADERLALDMGADRYLRKPASRADILAALNDVAGRPAARARSAAAFGDAAFLQEHSERLIAKLEHKNIALAAAEAKFRTLVEQSLVGLCVVQDEKLQYVNPKMVEIFGFSEREMTSRSLYDFFPPEDRARAREHLRQRLSGEVPTLHHRLRMLHRSGAVLQIDAHDTLTDSNGRPAVIGTFLDVTEQARAEDALARLASIVQSSKDAIVSKTLDGIVTSWNPAAERIFGHKSAEMIGAPLMRLVPAGRREEEIQMLEQLGRGQGLESFETQRQTKAGKLIDVSITASPIIDANGKVIGASNVARDISARKRDELRKEIQASTVRILAEAAPFPETARKVLDLVCRRLRWEMGAVWSMDRTKNRLRCQQVWHPPSTEFLEFAQLTLGSVFASGEDLPGLVWAGKTGVCIPDISERADFARKREAARLGLRGGLAFPIMLRDEMFGVLEFFSVNPLEPDADLLDQFATLGTQIGQFMERKQMEEQFRQSQKMEAVGQLAGGVAHDFNNLLTVIQGHTQMALATENLDPQIAEDLRTIFDTSQRAARLTSQLLTFSRKQVIQLRSLDLGEVVNGMSKMLGRVLGETIALRIELARSLPAAQADSGMVEQVLLNLAVNARDAMPRGGILTIAASRELVNQTDLAARPFGRPGEFVRLSVTDTGCGMEPEIMRQIFEPFFTTKQVGCGTGLGLSTVHGIAQQHGGWVEVESRVGSGSVFRVYFPAAQGGAKDSVRETVMPPALGGHETILIVEDEQSVRDLAGRILKRLGYRVLEAGSGPGALSVCEQEAEEISLVITDMVMPGGMTGLNIADHLHQNYPGVKVVYCTGYGLDALQRNLRLELGVNYLPKPYTPKALAEIVRRNLGAPAAPLK